MLAFEFQDLLLNFCIDFSKSNSIMWTRSESDILIGGHFPNVASLEKFTLSTPYFQDDLTWCIQKSKYFSMIINLFLGASLVCWFLMIFGVGGLTACVIYLMLPFDFEYKHRNHRDWTYITFQVVLAALIGINQRFNPKYIPLRVFYGFVIIIMVFAWNTFFLLGFQYFTIPAQRWQVSTVKEISENNFELTGSAEVLALISFDERVSLS